MIVDATLIKYMHYEYLRHLNAGGDKFPIALAPPSDRKGDARARCSALNGCATQSAFDRIGMDPTHPFLVSDFNYSKLLLFEEGRRSAEVWQEAFSFYCDSSTISVEHEVDLSSTRLAGRCDSIFTDPSTGDRYIVELKRTEYGFNEKHAFQWAGYSLNSGAERGCIVAQSRKDSVIIECSYDKPLRMWVFSDDSDTKRVIFTVTEDELFKEISRHDSITSLVRSGGVPVTDDSQKIKYFCVKQRKPEEMLPRVMKSGPDKGAVRDGHETPNCQYFGYCWGRFGNDYAVSHDDNGNLLYTEIE